MDINYNDYDWDRLWKEVYGEPCSDLAIYTKKLGDEMQTKLNAIRNHIREHRAEQPMIIWTTSETNVEMVDSYYLEWLKKLKEILDS